MSKTNKRDYREYGDQYDGYDSKSYISERNNKKKQKRLSNALKTKNIDDLINMNEDDEEFY